ncbi:transmembrane protein 106A isoform X6 [Erinaceus europaeus]|uniref:Transmembrane protein 106A isoform X6 n=1 Tax=Erinaceus europaeus TaxID=9365 RepID=A0ABM3YED6_ERIEU|nr:transmembrane protein 106A isoform X6 [Erinaceus europaeus]
MFSQLGSQEDENKAILSPVPGIGSKASNYSSTSGSKSFCSCVPYEGIAGASFVTCPTCQGSGEIPQELEKQLVALIPYGDQRLKPRHTKLSVFLAVLLCLLTSSLIVFFLFPRSVVVQPAGLNSSIVTFDEADIHLNITMFYAVSNRIWDENTYKICTWLKTKVHHVLLHIQAIWNTAWATVPRLQKKVGLGPSCWGTWLSAHATMCKNQGSSPQSPPARGKLCK